MASREKRKPNRLIKEKSPYLLQHAYNPVDWYPWSYEAFEKARLEDKPVFLSIGYSTCHWCHVMEKESFEDSEVAQLLNDAFVCVKVDREERPDIDETYMKAAQALNGTGGWPLTIIMTPDKKPFYAATYIPKDSRYGVMGLRQSVPILKKQWKENRKELEKSSTLTMEMLRHAVKGGAYTIDNTFLENSLKRAYNQNFGVFDQMYGGFGEAPKFPEAGRIMFLLRHWRRYKNKSSLYMAEKTLESMRLGGIYDQIGYGFHRYATDGKWTVPHFEKMLYDQAMLALAYTEAYEATKNEWYKDTAKEIFEFALRELADRRGAFYAAIDADSEGEEGAFYLWSVGEVSKIFDKKDASLATRLFNMSEKGNYFESRNGRNVLYPAKKLSELSKILAIDEAKLGERAEKIRKAMFSEREKRMKPGVDRKIMTDWNGLMIAALARASVAFGEQEYAAAAQKAAEFLLSKMFKKKTLYHRYFDGDVAVEAFLDDYAFLVFGLIELYEATFEPTYLKNAVRFNSIMLEKFWDPDGGLYSSSGDDGTLLRTKVAYDGATPSGNAMAISNLILLSHLTGDTSLMDRATSSLSGFSKQIESTPAAVSQLLVDIDHLLGPMYEVVVYGEKDAPDTGRMIKAINAEFAPNKVVLLIHEKIGPEISRIAEFTSQLKSTNEKATAYICFNNKCELPTNDPEKIRERLS